MSPPSATGHYWVSACLYRDRHRPPEPDRREQGTFNVDSISGCALQADGDGQTQVQFPGAADRAPSIPRSPCKPDRRTALTIGFIGINRRLQGALWLHDYSFDTQQHAPHFRTRSSARNSSPME